ncbi:hypothetical protein PSI21_03125 [Xenorhabdus griffiniae]|nr:hypothetical protein [Xenorhabdus griffiniae]MDC9604021.1 hypothetical protein [Xenorhabdus griffiniae]
MLMMGIGQQGLNSNIIGGVRFCIIFSIGYRIIESIFKDEYTLADFIGNITIDMAKTAIVATASWTIGSILTASVLLGGSIIAVAGIVFLVGLGVALGLDYFDKKYQISNNIINSIKNEIERKKRTPEMNLQQIFNGLGNIK